MQRNINIELVCRSASLTHQYRSSLCYLANVFVCLHYFLDPASQWVRLDSLEASAHDEVMMLPKWCQTAEIDALSSLCKVSRSQLA